MSSNSLTTGFVDLATFDELETYLYGGPGSYTPFVRATKRATWFTQVPVQLSNQSGTPGFGVEWAARVTRGGDYMLYNWLRVTLSAVTLDNALNQFAGASGASIRWTRNFMHNLISHCSITFNDMAMAKFDNYHLDFWASFTVPAGKRNGYDNMIGNLAVLTNPGAIPGNSATSLPSAVLNLPLPLPNTRDSGVSLPTAALPYNDIAIKFRFRAWTELLLIDNHDTGRSAVPTSTDISGADPTLSAAVWANYAIVSNDERRRMGRSPRDIVIEQVQTFSPQSWDPTQTRSFDLRFSHAVKVMFFAARNTTVASEWSNYTCASPVTSASGVNFATDDSVDPFDTVSLLYENTTRLADMPVDYFTLVNPFYHAVAIPLETGYHCYSFSLDFADVDPLGSTNFGKLTGVSIVPTASSTAVAASAGTGTGGEGADTPQSFTFVLTCVNNTVVRISGGALGFPVL